MWGFRLESDESKAKQCACASVLQIKAASLANLSIALQKLDPPDLGTAVAAATEVCAWGTAFKRAGICQPASGLSLSIIGVNV